MTSPQQTPDSTASFALNSDDSGCVVLVRGEVDLTNAAALETAAAAALERSPGRVTFDMRATTFLDSSGLAVLIGLMNRSVTVAVRNPSVAVRRVIEVSGLAPAFGLSE